MTNPPASIIVFDSDQGGDGERRVIWDGIDADAVSVDDTGLRDSQGNIGVDLTEGDGQGFELRIGTDTLNETVTVRVYSDDGNAGTANRFSSRVIDIPMTAGFNIHEIEYVTFASFTPNGGGADFTNVSAIELDFESGQRTDGTAELIGAIGPNVFTTNFDNFEEAELGLTKTVDNATPNVGDQITYTVTLTNNGPAAATSVQVTDQLPTGVTFISSTAGNNFNSATGVWDIGGVPNGGQASISIVGRVDSIGTKTNTATVSQNRPNRSHYDEQYCFDRCDASTDRPGRQQNCR